MIAESKVTKSVLSSELRVGVLCVSLDPSSRERLVSILVQASGACMVGNVGQHITAREAMRLLEPFQHRVCLLDFDENADEIARVGRRLRDECDASVSIFAASSDGSPEQIVGAMRSGCSEYLLKPFTAQDVLDAFAQIKSRWAGKRQTEKGRVITLMGAKGGMGVTALALHLALNLVQRHQRNCLLVDQHPALGDVSLYLGLRRHQYSFYELVQNTDRLDADLLHGFTTSHASGLQVLDSPEAIQAFPHVSPDAIEHTLAFLAENYQFVILDTPAALTEDTCAAIRQSDRLEIILTPELPAIRNAVRSIEYLTGLHYPEENIDIVLNRYSRRSVLSEEEIEGALRRKITYKIPNNYGLIINAINAGVPVAGRKSDIPVAFDYWGDRLVGTEPDVSGSGRRGWLGLFSA